MTVRHSLKTKVAFGAAEAPLAAAQMPLNKFLAHCGICSRRAAVAVIKAGQVSVNGQIITTPAHSVVPKKDVVCHQNKTIALSEQYYYILLNKPKDCLSTTDDPLQRKTVIDIISARLEAKIAPVGRLDRNTTGLLLLTNDGALMHRLTHPRFQIKKIYEVHLDKALTKKDFLRLSEGVVLEDGPIRANRLAYLEESYKKIGIELHSGRNRIIRRMFAFLGYEVLRLDRVSFAGLTKKNLPRGKWRALTEAEVRRLKYLNLASGRDS